MNLSVALQHHFDGFDLDVAFTAGPGVTAIFGPSGSGKTTVINALAGLLDPDHGHIELHDRVLFDRQQRINIPPFKRRIGYVFQDSRLFPHMSVERNIGFGARVQRTTMNPTDVSALTDMLALNPLLQRLPRDLSGGEKQRVALARALLSNPDILLMDEPLAALDEPRKEDILPYFEQLRDHTNLPILYVSHALSEMARLADDIVILQQGRVALSGPVQDVLSDPAALPFVGVAEAGAILPANVIEHGQDGLSRLALDGGELLLPGVTASPGSALKIRVLASDVLISLDRPVGLSSRNILPVVIIDLHRGAGPGVAVQMRCGQDRLLARITARAAEELCLRPGLSCYAILKATAVPRRSIGKG